MDIGFDSGLTNSSTYTINITDSNREHYPSYSTFSILLNIKNSLSLHSHLVFLQAGDIPLFFLLELLLKYRYFEQVGHCGMGMVGSINAQGDTYATYLAAAKAIGANETLVHFISSLK